MDIVDHHHHQQVVQELFEKLFPYLDHYFDDIVDLMDLVDDHQ